MSDKPVSKTIFIGNIPYGLSEEQIMSLFGTVGQVLNFRLVTDADTGRPKGYGFAEFADADHAASAVRNLNDYTIMGRQLRVDFSHKDGNSGGGGGAGGGSGNQPGGQPGNPGSMGANAGTAAPVNVTAVPPGVPLPPGVSCPDAISQTLATIGPAQLLDILSQFKGVVTQSPDSAKELLRQQPQLAYAIFQCLLTMGLVDSTVLKTVIEGVSAGQPAAPTPPVAQPYQPPQQQPVPQPAMPQLPPEQLQAIRSVLQMPDAQYKSLAPAERAQVDALRSQYGSLIR